MSLPTSDMMEIQKLYARYARAIDRGEIDAWVTCFTQDGEFRPSRGGLYVGQDAIREFGKMRVAQFVAENCTTRHWTSGLILDPEGGDHARGTCYAFLMKIPGTGVPYIEFSSVYTDRLLKVSGQWKFQSRESVKDSPPQLPV